MDGYEVAARLRREECCKDAVIIAVSGYGQEEDRRRSSEAGFDHHLVKPVDFETLLAVMDRAAAPRTRRPLLDGGQLGQGRRPEVRQPARGLSPRGYRDCMARTHGIPPVERA